MRELRFRVFDGERMRYDVTGFEHGYGNEMEGVFLDGDYYSMVSGSTTSIIDKRFAQVMQYTGLKDKNGKRIYEGDIVGKAEIDKSYHKCVIRYSDRFAKFVFCPAVEEWDLDRCVVGNPFLRKEYEIIGNIYENKALLGEVKCTKKQK